MSRTNLNYLDEFDPNDMPQPYATYTHGRTPHFKLHQHLAHATSALSNNASSGCAIYERQGDKWVQIARVEPNYYGTDPATSKIPPRCDRCGAQTAQHDAWLGRYVIKARQRLVRAHSGKLVKPLRVETVCENCV